MNDADLHASKSDIIRELFMKTADQTYVVARWCFLNRLYLDFYWNGLHAFEKYLKASLLFNDRSAISPTTKGKEYGHNIERLFAEVRKYAGPLIPKDLKKPSDLQISRWQPESAAKFVERLNRLGDPNNRYNMFGFSQRPDDIYKFDRLVFEIRRVCINLEADYFQRRKGAPAVKSNATILSNSPSYQPNRLGSRLSVLTLDKATDEVKTAALKHNLPFAAPDYDHGGLPSHSSADNPVLYRRIIVYAEQGTLTADDSLQVATLADWTIANIFLPADAKREIADARDKLLQSAKQSDGA